ncbi:bis-aminopropyl spermidine synthase family protein [Vagococcus sp. BWB3-3]|uniref:Bis-aminopropyl spermidine synthase family protein n=1 Tax=Vagococcus allomyrinae TaxID=2794353 RepID=A0A940SXU4_9ENTE|nr:bis-aminopropyl spermidine synthase family protein [Vagococcus allomyrinae]MBP1043691.1 bis-aminopropyl spermidine synthase family protein [Vagococcus allomyrinae]
MNLTEIIKERTKLKEPAEIINQLLVEMYLHKKISTGELGTRLSLPIPVVAAIRKELTKFGLVINQGGPLLSRKGLIYVEQQLGWSTINKDYYLKLLNSQTERTYLSKQLVAELSAGVLQRPPVEVRYDQAFATLETSVARAFSLLAKHQLVNHRVLFLGDDDLTSLAVGLLLKKIGRPHIKNNAVTIYEMSGEIIRCLKESAVNLDLEIDCFQIDFRDSYPELYLNQFDVVFVDPPYTLSGLKLFLSRAIGASRLGTGMIYLSFGKKAPAEQLAIQQLISNQNLIVADIRRDFNQYQGAAIIGGKSDLYVLSTTADSYPVIPKASNWNQFIYTGEVNIKQVIYRCPNCQQLFPMEGLTPIVTIEMLKEKGCSMCGGKKFARLTPNAPIQKSKQRLGNHYLLDLNDCSEGILSSVKSVEEIMLAIICKCQLTVVNHCFH